VVDRTLEASDPASALEPDHPPDPVQLVALVLLQLKVVEPPVVILVD
jgi:hypothetical protein